MQATSRISRPLIMRLTRKGGKAPESRPDSRGQTREQSSGRAGDSRVRSECQGHFLPFTYHRIRLPLGSGTSRPASVGEPVTDTDPTVRSRVLEVGSVVAADQDRRLGVR